MGSRSLVQFLQNHAGQQLRGVVRYDHNDTDILHLREDIENNIFDSQIDRSIRRLRPEAEPEEERAFPFEELYVTVRRFDEAILLHFPTGHDRGIVVTLEPSVSSKLNAFTDECIKRIES